jgi:hypothetical protein
MIKKLIAGVVVAGVTATAAVAGIPTAPTSDSDVDRGPGRNVARAHTTASKVDTAIARRNRASDRGRFRITCTKGNNTWSDRGVFLGRVRIMSNLGGLHDPTCHLVVRAIALDGNVARARATLLGDNN